MLKGSSPGGGTSHTCRKAGGGVITVLGGVLAVRHGVRRQMLLLILVLLSLCCEVSVSNSDYSDYNSTHSECPFIHLDIKMLHPEKKHWSK